MNAQWIKKCNNLTSQNVFKYSIQDALDVAEVEPKDFSYKLRRFRASLSKDEFVNALYRAGFGQEYNIQKRVDFVSKVMNVSKKKEVPQKRTQEQTS